MNAVAMIAIKLVLGVLGDFLVRAVKSLSNKATTDRLAHIAEFHVRALVRASTLTNEEKRQRAFDGVKKDAKALGIEAGDWIVNTAIELALGAVKADR